MTCNITGDILSNLIIIAIYSLFIFVILKKMEFEKIDWAIFKKISFFSIIISLIITYIIREQYNLNYLGIEQLIIIFLLFAFLISIPIYVIVCRNKFRYSPLLLSVMCLTIFVSIFLISIFPVINEYNNSLNSGIIDNTDDKTIDDTNHDDIDTNNTEDTTSEPAFEDYINENIRGVIYSEYAGIDWETNKIKEKFIFFIFNNGTENIDEDLQLSISFLPDKDFSLTKPNDKNNLSYSSNETKPWVFGEKKITTIRWNKTLPIATLSTMGVQWAIIYLETDVFSEDFFDYRQSITFSAIINDIYSIDVKKMPIYVEPPSENPKYWDIDKVLQDIKRYG